jgi:hypothetical protein
MQSPLNVRDQRVCLDHTAVELTLTRPVEPLSVTMGDHIIDMRVLIRVLECRVQHGRAQHQQCLQGHYQPQPTRPSPRQPGLQPMRGSRPQAAHWPRSQRRSWTARLPVVDGPFLVPRRSQVGAPRNQRQGHRRFGGGTGRTRATAVRVHPVAAISWSPSSDLKHADVKPDGCDGLVHLP